MHQSKAPLKYWLKQQQQIIQHCISAELVRIPHKETSQLIAHAPDHVQPHVLVASTIKEVEKKKRLHLMPIDNQHMLIAQPIMLHNQLWGAVILHITSIDKKDIAASVKLLQQGMPWLQFLLNQPIQNTKPNQTQISANLPSIQHSQNLVDTPHESTQAVQLLNMVRSLLKDNSLEEVTISLVNFLATQLKSSRVCLGLQEKQGIYLSAVSFSANFDRRTKAMQDIVAAMDEAIDQRVDIHLEADTKQEKSETHSNTTVVLRHHQALLDTQHLFAIDSFLLRKESQIVGVITLEYTEACPEEQKKFLQAALAIATNLITIKQESSANIRQRITSYAITKTGHYFGKTKTTRNIIGLGLLIAVCTLFLPVNYWISSNANLQTTLKYLLVAPQDGYLSSISARPGMLVKKGDVLAQLNDEDLRLERQKLFSQLQQSQQEYDNALATANRAQAAIANEKIIQANSQLQLIEQQQLRAQLTAPNDGIITSDDISQSQGAPVKQGQILFEVSSGKGYLVQLWVDERDIAALNIGQEGHLKLSSIPNETFEVTVKAITPISEIREGKNYFRVEATLNRESDLLRPGMTGSGKILVGREPLGWIWFHDAWHWLRLSLWL